MNKSDLIDTWLASHSASTFVTPKHDPASLAKPETKPRTVLAQVGIEFVDTLKKGEFTIKEYQNTNAPKSPLYYELIPNDPGMVPGSGINAGSTVGNYGCDRLVVVSGINQGWHVFAEKASKIDDKVKAKSLIFVGDVK